MAVRILHILITILIGISFQTIASDTIVLKNGISEIDITANFYDLYRGNDFDKNEVSLLNDIPFSTNKDGIDNTIAGNSTYWLRIVLDDKSTWRKRYVFEVYDVHIDDFSVYTANSEGKYTRKQAGQMMNFGDREEYAVTNFVFDLPIQKGTPCVIYIRIKSKDVAQFDFHIKTQNYFTTYTTNEYHFLGYYYGILFIMAAYNLLLFINSKEKVYMYYVGYVLACVLFSYSDDGLGFQYWWPNHPGWNLPITYYLAPLAFVISFVLYSRKFLNLNIEYPNLDRIVLWSLGIYLFYLPFEIWVLPPEYHLNQLFSIPFIVVYGISIYVFKKGYKAGRFFIVGYTFVFLSVMILQLRNYGMIEAPPGFWSIMLVYSFKIGIVLEILVLSYALGDRIKIMKGDQQSAQKVIIAQLEENKKLQDKVNRELEEKVDQRTVELKEKATELEDANQKLEELTSKLNEANAKLDYDNWQLTKEVKQEKKARLLSRKMDYDEFMKVFNDELVCYKHLEKLKWGDSFKCRKCSNEKFIKRSRLLSRKCTKCNHIESSLADTIYQGVKFPLSKAFYITYLTCQKDNKSTVNELADKLELARNTCWKFRKKVQDRISDINEQNPKVDTTNWDSIILLKSL